MSLCCSTTPRHPRPQRSWGTTSRPWRSRTASDTGDGERPGRFASCRGWFARQAVDLLVCPSGAMTPTCKVPQVVLAQNPWCFVPLVHQGWNQRIKAALQRRAYRQAFRSADLMVYISDYLRQLYRTDAGAGRRSAQRDRPRGDQRRDPRRGHAAAGHRRETVRTCWSRSRPWRRWKGAETLIRALQQMRADGIDAQLRLVGPWPEAAYETEMRELIQRLGLQEAVEITGQVSREELHRHYAEARVFTLMSQCESFGIPAAEAQAFATPTVVSTGCAMPEVCGPGGVAGPPGDVPWVSAGTDPDADGSGPLVPAFDRRADQRATVPLGEVRRPLMSMFSVA